MDDSADKFSLVELDVIALSREYLTGTDTTSFKLSAESIRRVTSSTISSAER